MTYGKVAGGGKGAKGGKMELFTIVCAELGEGGNLHILTYGVKYFFFRGCPGSGFAHNVHEMNIIFAERFEDPRLVKAESAIDLVKEVA